MGHGRLLASCPRTCSLALLPRPPQTSWPNEVLLTSPHPAPHISKCRSMHKRVLRGDVMKPEALQAVVKHSIEKDFLEGRRETRKQWPVGICSLQKYFPFIKRDLWLDEFKTHTKCLRWVTVMFGKHKSKEFHRSLSIITFLGLKGLKKSKKQKKQTQNSMSDIAISFSLGKKMHDPYL